MMSKAYIIIFWVLNTSVICLAQESVFTGEILPVFYVKDVQASVSFYKELGFKFNHYHDYEKNASVKEWVKANPPIYAEMQAGTQKFAIHLLPGDTSGFFSRGTRHYFEVKDVRSHFFKLKKEGLAKGEIIERPWMIMFSITGPDGHSIYFYTRPGE